MACPWRLRRARVCVCHHGRPCRVGGLRSWGPNHRGQRGAAYAAIAAFRALLGMVAFGLLCLAVWRMAQSILNSDRLGNDRKALVRRIGYGVSGATHAGLAFFAISVIFGVRTARGSDDQSARDWTAYLLAAPFGRWLVGAVGLIIVATGIGIAVKAAARCRALLAQRLCSMSFAPRDAREAGRYTQREPSGEFRVNGGGI